MEKRSATLELDFYKQVWRMAANRRRWTVKVRRLGGGADGDSDLDANLFGGQHRLSNGGRPDCPAADRVAIGLAFARHLDGRPELRHGFQQGAPVVAVEVPDRGYAKALSEIWPYVVFGPEGNVEARARFAQTFEMSSFAERQAAEILESIQQANPVLVVADSQDKLPAILDAAATARINLCEISPEIVDLTVRAVTGRKWRVKASEAQAAASSSLLSVSVRFDRTASESLERLSRPISLRESAEFETSAGVSSLTLDDLHGLKEATEWAKSSLDELAAWRADRAPFDRMLHSAVLVGPSGCGKTVFAVAYANASKLPVFINASFSKWQSSGEAHLGHCLRAMRRDFAAAKVAGGVIFIDELDSFTPREGTDSYGSRSHHDTYNRQVVNALLEEVDSAAGRDGVVLLGACNELAVDKALLRPGRFTRVIRIGLPDASELLAMFRMRLGNDLELENLEPVIRAASGMTGADVELAVGDARRQARRQGRDLRIGDLVRTIAGEPSSIDPQVLKRIAFHEAGHILLEVVFDGPDNLIAVLSHNGGRVTRNPRRETAGTYDDYSRALQVLLAGRCAEVMEFSSASHGSGGAPTSDIAVATKLAAGMVGSFGLAGPSKLLFHARGGETAGVLASDKLRRAALHELEKAEAVATSELKKRRPALEKVAEVLLREGTIDGQQVQRILETEVAALLGMVVELIP